MLTWIAQISILSLIIIFLVHHIFIYFKTTLTVPNVKDLVDKPHKQYEEIFKTLALKSLEEQTTSSNMKEELKHFLNQQQQDQNNSTSKNVFSKYS